MEDAERDSLDTTVAVLPGAADDSVLRFKLVDVDIYYRTTRTVVLSKAKLLKAPQRPAQTLGSASSEVEDDHERRSKLHGRWERNQT